MSLFDRGLRGNVQSAFTTLDASTTAYSNPRMPASWNGSVSLALNYVLDALYPNYKGTVATPAALPGTATANDFYIVTDDGDGKSAGYVYSVINGVTAWLKRYDVDWSYEQILSDTITRTSYMYAAKYGYTDKTASGTAITGTYAGQRIYGGDATAQNLTLTANVVDSTGYVQADNVLRPTATNTLDLGMTGFLWRTGYFGTSLKAGTATLAGGSLTDTSGAISFGSSNLTTTGSVTGASLKSGTMTLSGGSVADTSGAITFGANNLTTTGIITGAASSKLADITFTNGTFSTSSAAFSFSSKNLSSIATLTATEVDAGNIKVSGATVQTNANATQLILQTGTGGNTTTTQINSLLTANFDATVTGVLTVSTSSTSPFTGPVQVGTAAKLFTNASNAKLQSLLGDIQLVPAGNITVSSNILPTVDATDNLGSTSARFQNMYLSGAIGDGTNTISAATLLSLRGINTAVGTGNILSWNGTQWVPESTSGVIDHTTLTSLTTGDAGHTQFALLAGRTGGQTINGGTASGNSLTLESTSNATKGFVLVSSSVAPTTDANYTTSWQGTDLGGSSRYFRDLYTRGIHYGLRLDQYAAGAYPVNSGQNVGRVIWDTTNNVMAVDSGSTWKQVGITALTGDISASGNGSVASTLATVNSNVGSFTYASITVNAKGLITAASSGSAALSNPMTTGGDIIYGGASGTPTRLANGSSGQVLQSAGGTSAPTWSALTAPTVSIVTTSSHSGGFSANTTGTYTTPAGVKAIKVTCVGGGAGGGGAAAVGSGSGAGAGGGGGGTVIKWITTPNSTYSYTVGTGGSGGSAGNNAGSAGNNTTFGTTFLTANGGNAGGGSSTATSVNILNGSSSGGSGSGGDVIIPGGASTNGICYGSTNSQGGIGGGTPFGAPTGGSVTNGTGGAGQGYGAGGNGGCTLNTATTQGGGAGAPGIIIVQEYYQ